MILRSMPLTLAVAALLLAGCGSEVPEEPAPPPSDTTVEAEVPTAAEDPAVPAGPRELVIYTSRQPHLVEPLFDAYADESGVTISYISDDAAALIERIDAEGPDSPADVLITVDAGNLWNAAARDLLEPMDSEIVEQRIPAELMDPDGLWTGLSVRARTIVYHPERVDPANLSTYEALADPEWEGRLCLRTSKKVYNQSLVAMMIERLGEERTEEIVSGWVDNLATDVFSSDTRLIEAIAAGQCDVGIVNTYYLGRLQAEDPDYPVRLFWANQETSGTHVNISGAGITKSTNDPGAARAFIEWMVGEEAQEMIAASNLEFPAARGIALDPVVEAWGEFEGDRINLSVAGKRQAEAVRLMDRAGWR
ncbi:MAG: extracellular solute-binding protein [Wenzhouxiangellaceae bacterium]|nr:extracellular solute-binding protein [Wenzhouxiangellaceae bacterium]